jgi:hypothetical protein
MTDRQFGIMGSARAVLAFALAAGTIAPGFAQQAETPTPAPSSGRPIDFRLPPPGDDGRAPGVQGPSNNGIAPSGPGETRPTPSPAPAPTPTAPRVIPTQPTASPTPRTVAQPAGDRRETPTPTPPRAVPTAGEAPSSPSSTPSATDVSPGFSPAPPESTTPAAPSPASETALAPVAPAEGGATPIWAWLLALLAAAGAGFWYWRRRPALAGDAPVEPSAAPAEPVRPTPAAAAPRAAPVPAPASRAPAIAPLGGGVAPQPVPAPPTASPLVTRAAAERRALVSIALDVKGIRVTPEHVAVAFALNIVNQGPVDATGLMVRIALNQGSAMTEPVLARFFDGAGGSVLRDDLELKAGAGEALTTEAMLPRAMVEPLMIGGKPMLVPVMAFDVTYHWEGDADAFGQIAGSFVLGRESGASGSDKLAPLPLDRASYILDRPGSRSTAVRRSQ